jgi:hypothetical protein
MIADTTTDKRDAGLMRGRLMPLVVARLQINAVSALLELTKPRSCAVTTRLVRACVRNLRSLHKPKKCNASFMNLTSVLTSNFSPIEIIRRQDCSNLAPHTQTDESNADADTWRWKYGRPTHIERFPCRKLGKQLYEQEAEFKLGT